MKKLLIIIFSLFTMAGFSQVQYPFDMQISGDLQIDSTLHISQLLFSSSDSILVMSNDSIYYTLASTLFAADTSKQSTTGIENIYGVQKYRNYQTTDSSGKIINGSDTLVDANAVYDYVTSYVSSDTNYLKTTGADTAWGQITFIDTTYSNVIINSDSIGTRAFHASGNSYTTGGNGDVNNSGTWTALDALMAEQIAYGLLRPNEATYMRADIIGNGIVSSFVPRILQHVSIGRLSLDTSRMDMKAAVGRAASPVLPWPPPGNNVDWTNLEFHYGMGIKGFGPSMVIDTSTNVMIGSFESSTGHARASTARFTVFGNKSTLNLAEFINDEDDLPGDSSVVITKTGGINVSGKIRTEDSLSVRGNALIEGNLTVKDGYEILQPENNNSPAWINSYSLTYVVHDTAHHDNVAWKTLSRDGAGAQIEITANTSWKFHISVSGHGGSSQYFGYDIYGLLVRDGAGNTTMYGGTSVNAQESDANFDAKVIADDTNEYLLVQVNDAGSSGGVVTWTANIDISVASNSGAP